MYNESLVVTQKLLKMVKLYQGPNFKYDYFTLPLSPSSITIHLHRPASTTHSLWLLLTEYIVLTRCWLIEFEELCNYDEEVNHEK